MACVWINEDGATATAAPGSFREWLLDGSPSWRRIMFDVAVDPLPEPAVEVEADEPDPDPEAEVEGSVWQSGLF